MQSSWVLENQRSNQTLGDRYLGYLLVGLLLLARRGVGLGSAGASRRPIPCFPFEGGVTSSFKGQATTLAMDLRGGFPPWIITRSQVG